MNRKPDIFELLIYLSGIDGDDYENDYKTFELISDKYGLEDYDGFYNLICDLIELVDVGTCPLTKTRFKGFAKDNMWLATIEVERK